MRVASLKRNPFSVFTNMIKVPFAGTYTTQNIMKRDPVLAQLDFLINGPSKTARTEESDAEPAPEPQPPLLPPAQSLPSLAPDPVLAQLDALINGAPAALTSDPVAPAEAETLRGPPGILREFGGIRGWMATRDQQSHGTSPMCSTPPHVVSTNSPSLDQITLAGTSGKSPHAVVKRQ